MMPREKLRKVILFSVLGIVVLVVIIGELETPTESPPEAAPPARTAVAESQPADTGGQAPAQPEAAAHAASAGQPAAPTQEAGAAPPVQQAGVDIFAVRTWEPPPPPPAPPEPPQAPPLPFRFIGRIVEPGKPTAFLLANGEKTIVAQVGDALGRDYRVEKYENGQLHFRYLPLNSRQSLNVGQPS